MTFRVIQSNPSLHSSLSPYWESFMPKQKKNQTTLRSCEHKTISPKSATLNFYEVLNFGQHHIGTFFKRSTYLPQYTYKVDQNQNQVKFRSVQTLLRITHLAHRKSYLVIICPNSHEKLTKSEIRSSSSRFEHCSESLIQPIGSHIWSLFVPKHMKSLPKVKLGQVQVGSNIAQNHSYSPQEVISGHYLPQFT